MLGNNILIFLEKFKYMNIKLNVKIVKCNNCLFLPLILPPGAIYSNVAFYQFVKGRHTK